MALLDAMDKILQYPVPVEENSGQSQISNNAYYDTEILESLSQTDFDNQLEEYNLEQEEMDLLSQEFGDTSVPHDLLESELDNILNSPIANNTYTNKPVTNSQFSRDSTIPKLQEIHLKTGHGQNNLVFELSASQKKELSEFLGPIGFSELLEHFCAEAVDLSLMMEWKDPVRELKALGITQHGALNRLVHALSRTRNNHLGNSNPSIPTLQHSVYGLTNGANTPVSSLGKLVLQKGEQLLQVLQHSSSKDVLHKPLATVVHLSDMEFEFSFSIVEHAKSK